MKTNKPDRSEILQIIIMIVVSTILVLLGSTFFPLFIILYPIPYIIIGVKYETKYTIISFILTALIIGLIAGPMIGIILAVVFLPLIIGLSYSIKKDKKSMKTLAINTVILFVSIMILMTAVQILEGVSYISELEKTFPKTLDFYTETLEGIGSLDLTSSDISDFREGLKDRLDYMLLSFPSILMVSSLIVTAIVYLMSSLMLRRLGHDLKSIPKFARFQLPSNILFGIGLMLIVTYILGKLELFSSETIVINIVTITTFLFSIQGLSVIDFKLISTDLRLIPRILIMGLLVILMLPVGFLFAIFGVLDIIFNFRKLGVELES